MRESSTFDALVIGAGVAGLFCATELADAGLRVGVLEARACPGGRARSWHHAGMGLEVDVGPHVISSEHVHFMRMLRRVGTATQVDWQPGILVTLLEERRLLDVASVSWPPPLHLLANGPMTLRRLGVRASLSHWPVIREAARVDEAGLRALDAVDAFSWLGSKGMAAEAIDWFWRSTLLSLLNVPLEECSAASALRIFRLMLGRSGYHFGFPRVGLSQLYVPGCSAAIRERGGEVYTRSAVRALDVQDGFVRGVRLRSGALLLAPWCILALPPWHAAPLLARTREPLLAPLQATARRFLGAPYTSTVLALDRRLGPRRFWARVWDPEDLNTDFYDLANIRPELAGAGSVVACNAIGPNAHPEWSEQAVVARTLQELQDFAPAAREARVLGASVHRIRGAVPQPRPGTETLRPGARTAVTGLLLAGDWTDTALPCSMESAARSAALAAEVILQRTIALAPPETYGLVGLLRSRRAK
ncbi:FAD-dependent oxidoreductase [Ramlibacter monticola]|uniref:FAD-dependent oxidoreductase n=1 Tax=Ramlibacter monticola TaxID=1926872 RepID=A0A936YY47_9BURK|nr:FAD-dependent oxidoreductase [Ramlibacter monticola]MBL0390052.1 FAD-dependent oxidoreductase [Ramlibacter monticola]